MHKNECSVLFYWEGYMFNTLELFKNVSLYILDILVQSYGGDKYNNIKTKIIIYNILKNDKNRIKKVFILPSEKDMIEDVLVFLCKKVFCDIQFFETEALSVEKEEALWKLFCEEHNKYYDYIGNEHRNHLIKCVNEHNNEICKRLLDDMTLLGIKISEREASKSHIKLDQIISTLENNTELQDMDIDLDYLNIQLESIMKSMRNELEKIRHMQNRCLICVMMVTISLIFVPILGKYYVSSFGVLIFNILVVVLILLALVLMINIWLSIEQKKKIDRNVSILFDFHYDMYNNYLEEKINRK